MMEERTGAGSFPEGTPAWPGNPGSAPGLTPPHLADPRALQILTTEHWSLLATRSLSYNEAFTRAGMFLSFLAASLVALALVAQATGFGTDLALIAAIILALDLFIGVATLGRIASAGAEELHCVRGMNRIRHAYLEIAPDLEPYFVAPFHDDPAAILDAYSAGKEPAGGPVASLAHGLTTTPGMVAVINTVIAAALVTVVALGLGLESGLALAVGLVTFVILFVIQAAVGVQAARLSVEGIPVHFPSPPRDDETPRPNPLG